MGDAGEAAALHQNRCERMWSSGGGSLSKPRLRKNRVSLFLSLSRLGRRGFVVEKVWTMHTAEENDDYPVLEPDG